jgi:hypothetical protein
MGLGRPGQEFQEILFSLNSNGPDVSTLNRLSVWDHGKACAQGVRRSTLIRLFGNLVVKKWLVLVASG